MMDITEEFPLNCCPRVQMRMECPECCYPLSEARYSLSGTLRDPGHKPLCWPHSGELDGEDAKVLKRDNSLLRDHIQQQNEQIKALEKRLKYWQKTADKLVQRVRALRRETHKGKVLRGALKGFLEDE